MYFVVPRVILFREEHSPRVFVERVDFVSAPGTSAANVARRGGPFALLTGMALFSFDKERSRFRLESVHPGFTEQDVCAATGFDYDAADDAPQTAAPDATTLALLRGRVRQELAESYPGFAATLPTWRDAA
jgi:glutaconate CoA-transferase subunit B